MSVPPPALVAPAPVTALGMAALWWMASMCGMVALHLVGMPLTGVALGLALTLLSVLEARAMGGLDIAPMQNWPVFALMLSTSIAPAPFLPRHGMTLAAIGPGELAVLALTVVLGPLAEELMFRGWLWQALRRNWAPMRTLAVTSLFFGLAHIGVGLRPAVISTCLGFVFGLSRIWCRSVQAPIALHIVHNAMTVLSRGI